MDIRQLLLAQHARTHGSGTVASDLPLEDLLLNGLTDEQIRRRPSAAFNSIAWFVWHMARSEDVAANVILAERPQVLDVDDWPRRLNVARRDIGTGMTSDEVSELSAGIDVAALRAYRAAVGRRTQEVLRALRPEDLDSVVDAEHIARVAAAGAFGPQAGWVAGLWQGRPKEFFLTFTVIGHSYTQLGEAWVVRELLLAGGA